MAELEQTTSSQAPEGDPYQGALKQIGSSLRDPKFLTSLALPLLLGVISKGRLKGMGIEEPGVAKPQRFYKGERIPKAPVEKLGAPEKGILSGPTEKAVKQASRPYRPEPALHEDVVQGLRQALLEKPELAQETIGEGGSRTTVARKLSRPAQDIARMIKRPEISKQTQLLLNRESRVRQDYFQKYGRKPTERMVIYRMGISEPEYRKLHQVHVPGEMPTQRIKTPSQEEEFTADEMLHSGGQKHVPIEKASQVEGTMHTPETLSVEDRVSFQKALRSLSNTEQRILLSIFNEGENLPHSAIAKELGVNSMAVSRMYQKAIKKLQNVMGIEASRGKTKDKPSLRTQKVEGGGIQAPKVDPRDKASELIAQIREKKFGKEHKFEKIKSKERSREEIEEKIQGLKSGQPTEPPATP